MPAGHVWVEGDNVDPRKTHDSNHFGPISRNLISGQVRAVVWPYVRWIRPEFYAGSPRVAVGKHPVTKPRVYDGEGNER